MKALATTDLLLQNIHEFRFEKVDQQTFEYDEHGQPTFTTGNIGLMVALKPAKPSNENPDPNADMILPEDEENGGEEEDDSTAIPGGILVATVRFFFSVIALLSLFLIVAQLTTNAFVLILWHCLSPNITK